MWDIWTSKKIDEVGDQTLVNGLYKSNLGQLNLAHLQKTFATEGSFFVKQTGRSPKAVFFDMDATLVIQESLVEMARYAGTEVEVARITERAMKGELDFSRALEERLATLNGVSEQVIFDVAKSLTIFAGVKEFINHCKLLSIPCHVVTGGFEEIAAPLLMPLGFTSIRANRLEVKNGRLTGRTLGQIMDAKGKMARLTEVCNNMGIDPTDAAAIGDGANDIPMLQAAGFKLAFQPKPVLVPYATAVNRTRDHSFWLTTLFQ